MDHNTAYTEVVAKNLSLIVPYRNRDEHLNIFIPYMNKYLNNINYSINIIEQIDNKPFNRAKLLNIGFDLTHKKHDYFCFHDIDMLPECDNQIYSYTEYPTHLATYVEQFNWGLAYGEYFGGVTLIDKNSFIKVNGFSNDYWGWGAEDDDFLKRCKNSNLQIYRRLGKYKSLYHKPNGDTSGGIVSADTLKNRELFRNATTETYKLNGLSNLQYSVECEQKIDNKTTLYKVKI